MKSLDELTKGQRYLYHHYTLMRGHEHSQRRLWIEGRSERARRKIGF